MSRAAVRDLAPYVPGTSVEEVRRRFGLERIVKLASNENPLGSSPKAMRALAHLDRLNLYFDDSHSALRERLAEPYGLRLENVVLGHGSNELVNIVAEAVLEAGDEAVMADPSFSLYRLVAALQGATPIEVPLRRNVHDVEAMLAAVTSRTKLMFVCDPNNPTGTALARVDWTTLLARLPERVLLVVDQAYREYMNDGFDAAEIVEERPNTLVLRTMSKVYGLASLRFGYGYGDAQTIGWLNRVRLPFNVSRPAALGALGAVDDAEFVAQSIAVNEAGKAFLAERFEKLAMRMEPTQANFYALMVPCTASRAYGELLERGIIVRSGDALRMPGYLRITIGTQSENEALLQNVAELLPTWRSG